MIYLDGPSLTAAIRNRNPIAEDSTGDFAGYVYQDRLFIDSYLRGPFVLSTYKHWLKCRDEFEVSLRARGIHTYYALVDSPEKFRWCKFIGMKSNYETIDNTMEIMKREF